MDDEVELPQEVARLLDGSIRSIEELETLLHLRAEKGPLTALDLSDALKFPEALAVAALQALVLNRLVVQVGEFSPLRYIYAPQTSELASAADLLSAAYQENRIQVIMVISTNAISRVRNGVLRMFSDSFGFPGPKRNG